MEIEGMNKLDKEIAIQYCWITLNIMRTDMPTKKQKTGHSVKNDRVQELQEQEKLFVSKIKKRNK